MFEVWTYPRPGYHVSAETLAEVWPPEMAELLASRCIAGAQTDAASSALREELKNGRIPEGVLTSSVLEYIKVNHLYGGVVK
jgi:nicotinic acid mononucleotide adenylyltransferase